MTGVVDMACQKLGAQLLGTNVVPTNVITVRVDGLSEGTQKQFVSTAFAVPKSLFLVGPCFASPLIVQFLYVSFLL